jgi:hypothetical protein
MHRLLVLAALLVALPAGAVEIEWVLGRRLPQRAPGKEI